MARIDKYEPMGGGFRAPLNAAIAASEVGKIFAVGLNASGRVVLGAGNTGIKGVIVVDHELAAGDIVDVMQDGEIVQTASMTAGTNYHGVGADGTISATASGNTYIGHTVEATRLVVRVAR